MTTTLTGLPHDSDVIEVSPHDSTSGHIGIPPASSISPANEVTDDDIANADFAKRHLAILGNEHVEMRAFPRDRQLGPYTHTQYYLAKSEESGFAADTIGLSVHTDDRHAFQGVYATLNEIDSKFFRSNHGGKSIEKGTRDDCITRRTNLFIDIDAERSHPRGGQVCANTDEHAAALKTAEKVVELCTSHGFPEPYVVDSGSGAQIYYRVDLQNNATSTNLVKRVLKAIGSHVDSPTAHVDQGVFNASRISRVPGTFNRKSPHTEDRPNRLVSIISAPESDVLELVEGKKLEDLANSYQSDEKDVVDSNSISSEPSLEPSELKSLVDEIVEYVHEHASVDPKSVRPKADGTYIDYPHCLFKGPAHQDGNLAIIAWGNGGVSLKCFHDKCVDKNWQSLQELFGQPFHSNVNGYKMDLWCDPIKRSVNDPLRLARVHADEWRTDAMDLSTTFFHGELHRFTPKHGWLKTRDKELAPWIRDSIQREFDENAKYFTSANGNPSTPKPLGARLVSDTTQALHSISRASVPIDAVAPFWMNQYIDWDADDLIVLENGALNIQEWLDNEDCFMPPTARLYYDHQTSFDYDSSASEKPHWDSFLKSLEQPTEWKMLLQEIMGYCLLPSYDLQKLFMFTGCSRAGKGVIVRVLENLLGGERAVCGLELKDFTAQFGLEKAIGKRLGVFGDVDMPQAKEAPCLIAKLKSVTGGDLVPIDRKHKPSISCRLKIKFIMLSNTFMALPDNSGAIQARTIPLKFVTSFVGKEDPTLEDKLIPEYPAIFNWALEGLRRLKQSNGRFTIPESTEDLIRQMSEEAAPIKTFFAECCNLDSSKAVRANSLYACYQQWCKQARSGEESLASPAFRKQFESAEPSIIFKRQKTTGAKTCNGFEITLCPYDKSTDGVRPNLYLGLSIKDDLPF